VTARWTAPKWRGPITVRRAVEIAALTALTAVLAWLLFVGLPRWYSSPGSAPSGAANNSEPAQAGRKIKARLFYVGEAGTTLTGVEQDVPFGASAAEQAKEIITAQLAPVAEPLISAVPPGTTLRAIFITEKGEAFVDLSSELATAHPGGSLNELLTVYTIVDALTVNLPAVSAVQLLVNGQEVDTLAGHVDLRRPLVQNLNWVQETVVDSR
jgi:hypothetical protein